MSTSTDSLAQAMKHYRAGNWLEAEQHCRLILHTQPQCVEALHLLGVVALQVGRFAAAVDYLSQAIQLKPDVPEAHNSLGNAWRGLKRLDDAVACYQQAIRLNPNLASGHNNLGVALADQGKHEQAIPHYRQALLLNPQYAETHNNLGNSLLTLKKWDEALAAFRRAIEYKPDYAVAHDNLGVALQRMKKPADALAHHRRAIELTPDFVEAYCNLGSAELALKHLDDAERNIRHALKLKPDFPQAHHNLAMAFTHRGKCAEAVGYYQNALRLQPHFPEAQLNLGLNYRDMGKLDEALVHVDQVLRVRPNDAEAHLARATLWILQGKFEEGWREYEWRWQIDGFSQPPRAKALWDGGSLLDKTILLFAEQGLGDTMQFIRYAPLVKERGATVVVQCQEPLTRLLQRCPGIDVLVPRGAALPDYDVCAPLMSLPFLFQNTVDNVPAQVPYLHAEPDLADQWRGELRSCSGLKVGIAWQGNPDHRKDQFRSYRLRQMTPLLQVPGVTFLSLQKGPGSDQLAEVAASCPILDLGAELDETSGAFVDTAAVVKNLDLVITPDTALAHLAGALGVPVWLALMTVPDFRWLMSREDTPWYPTMRLFRQTQLGNWEDVFERMAGVLRKKLALPPGKRPLTAPLSAGELVDKITILAIKRRHLTDPAKLKNVEHELAALVEVRDQALSSSPDLERLTEDLQAVNQLLWNIEDAIRLCERDQDFGTRFIELARSVYHHNDRRAALKRHINELVGSDLVEEKSYQEYARGQDDQRPR